MGGVSAFFLSVIWVLGLEGRGVLVLGWREEDEEDGGGKGICMAGVGREEIGFVRMARKGGMYAE